MKTLTQATRVAAALYLAILFGPVAADSFNLYALAHLSIDDNEFGADDETVFASNSSRIGFNGHIDIEDDVDVFFQYEPGMDLTGRGENDGNGPGRFDSLFTERRDYYLGLRNRAVGFRYGRLGILNHWLYDFDPFADVIGDLGNLWGATSIPGRADRAAQLEIYGNGSIGGDLFWAPEYNGQQRLWMGKLKLEREGLRVNLSLFEQAVAGRSQDHRAWAITGDSPLANGLIGYGLQVERNVFGVTGNDRESLNIGYTQPLGAGVLKLMASTSNSDSGTLDGQQIAIAYDYRVNANLLLYTAGSYVSNESLSRFSANGYGHGLAVNPPAGENASSLSLGLILQFEARLLDRQ